MREFVRLQWLQKAKVHAVRAAAVLMGYNLQGRRGDAVLVQAIEPSVRLDKYQNRLELEGRTVPDRLSIVKQIIEILQTMAKSRLGHGNLQLGSFLLQDGRVYLADAEAVHGAGLLMDDLLLLALSAAPYATLAEMQRAWNMLGPGGAMPELNRRGPSAWRSEMQRLFADGDGFGRLEWSGNGGQWSGMFFKRTGLPQRWSTVSRLEISQADWEAAWPDLKTRIDADELKVLKRGRSGDVLEGTVTLAGCNVAVVVKRPGRSSLRRSLTQVFCGSRAQQAWEKAWGLAVRGIPTAWPMLLMEKRVHGYVTDSLVVMEKVDGPVLAKVDASENPGAYALLMGRCGKLLREIERSGLFLYDAKAYNWIVMADPRLGPTPVLIDADSMRRMRVRIGGLNRLLRSLREDTGTGLSPENALALARGYRPFGSQAQLEQLAGVKA